MARSFSNLGYRLALPEAVPLLADLLSIALPEGRYPALHLTPQQQRQQTQDTLLAWLLEEAERQPVLAMWEDLHWADPSTLEFLGLLVAQAPTVPMLHVLTFRPQFTPPWPLRSHMTPITLNRLERPQVEALIMHLTEDKALPEAVMAHIVSRTDGVPLFVEELTKMLLESDMLREVADHHTLTSTLATATIPATLQDSLMARLDRLPEAREVAQFGAVIGRTFAHDMLQPLVEMDDTALHARLAKLVEAELHPLQGELLLKADGEMQNVELTPEACFRKAIDIARQQEVKLLELRAATSLARLWQSQGKRQEARDLLAPVLWVVSEGFDTADLKDAKALLRELEG